jgi:hypothetical protein
MSKHVSEWLNAYHDGELRGNKLHHVEEHLAECELCQAELESLEGISDVLHEVPTPEFIPAERFATQVNLRLSHKGAQISGTRILEIGWWMIPVGLVAIWIFFSTVFVVRDFMSTASQAGFISGVSNWVISAPSNGIYLSATLGQAGLLSGRSLSWAETTETITRSSFTEWSLQISIAILYLSWIAVWWARQMRRGPGRLLES